MHSGGPMHSGIPHLEHVAQHDARLVEAHELAWRPQAHDVAHEGEAGGLVERGPQLHAVPEVCEGQACKGHEQRQVGLLRVA